MLEGETAIKHTSTISNATNFFLDVDLSIKLRNYNFLKDIPHFISDLSLILI